MASVKLMKQSCALATSVNPAIESLKSYSRQRNEHVSSVDKERQGIFLFWLEPGVANGSSSSSYNVSNLHLATRTRHIHNYN